MPGRNGSHWLGAPRPPTRLPPFLFLGSLRALSRGHSIIWTKTDLTPDQPHTLVAWNDPAVGANPKPWAAFTGIIYTTDQTSAPGVALPPGQGGGQSQSCRIYRKR